MMHITGIGTAKPAWRYRQGEIWQALSRSQPFKALSGHAQSLLEKVLLGRNGIETRYLALNPLDDLNAYHPDALHARFRRHAPDLATGAARRALADAGVAADDIDAVLISTCTGYLCPGLTSYVAERLPLHRDVITLDLLGHGCSAALPNLQAAAALLASNRRCRTVLSICVEVCSAAFYLDDDPGVLVSACLFGDGAAALVLRNEPQAGKRSIIWRDCRSLLEPQQRDLLRFENRGGMLRNILTPAVPRLAAQSARQVLAKALADQQLRPPIRQSDIQTWAWHTGGRDVLNALAAEFGLDDDVMRWSWEVLSECGNISSASVLFVLERALQHNAPAGWWWLSAFGAGFSSYGALLEVGEPP